MSVADQQQLDRILTLLVDVLNADVVGAYLFGSAVLGGLRPESDLDVLAVSRRPTTRMRSSGSSAIYSLFLAGRLST